MTCLYEYIERRNARFTKLAHSIIESRVHEARDEHNEVKPSLLIVALELETVEIGIILYIVVVGLNAPAAFVIGIDFRCRLLCGGLEYRSVCHNLPACIYSLQDP